MILQNGDMDLHPLGLRYSLKIDLCTPEVRICPFNLDSLSFRTYLKLHKHRLSTIESELHQFLQTEEAEVLKACEKHSLYKVLGGEKSNKVFLQVIQKVSNTTF